ncbi:MAG TPA: hypothetical protein VE258_01815 [Ktedonobacterales bacterium]|nr:hypothetical protein [Ktedonobacterales bacterium]
MRNRGLLIGTLAGVVVALAIGTIAYAMHAHTTAKPASSLDLHSHVSVVCPGPTDTVSEQGVPAIQPRNNCTPSFTEQDVRAYLAHVMPLGKIQVIGQPTVVRVVFLTIRDLDQATGDSEWEANYPAAMVVCYVTLRGSFRVFGPPGSHPPSTLSTANILFDAHTGNELAVGAGP